MGYFGGDSSEEVKGVYREVDAEYGGHLPTKADLVHAGSSLQTGL
jgi:hypothetical protein